MPKDDMVLCQTNDNKKPAVFSGFYISPDYIELCSGGGAGNRTPDTTDMSRML
jgi:hypothetical protein